MKRKKEKEYGSQANMEPTAETEKSTPIQINVGFRPRMSVGLPPKSEPKTVPQRAMDMMKVP